MSRGQQIGFWAGLVLGGFCITFSDFVPRPDGLSLAALRLIGVTLLVGIWWVSEALPLGATALLPAALFPLLGIAPAKIVAPAYASPFILLLLGGFLLAVCVEHSGVHRRIALHVLRVVGSSPRRLVLGFAVAAALLSMWISNTATTLIMMPIALAIADRVPKADRAAGGTSTFAVAVLLATGYGASVGGMATPVGTPPNVIAMGALDAAFPTGPSLNFLSWAYRAAPLVVVLVPIIWFLLVRVYPRVPRELNLGAGDLIQKELRVLGTWRPDEKRALSVFLLAAILWVTRADVHLGVDSMIPGWASLFGLGRDPDDGTVAILAACLAFAMPSGRASGERLLPWPVALRVPWGLVLLFGGGIALSRGFINTGLSEFLGHALAELADGSQSLFLAVTTLLATFGTELVSNTALANVAMPILAATALAADMDPRVLLVPVALACSCAFMMPAATGPNAIVFGTGRIRIGQMVRAGFLANWAAWVVIFLATWMRL